MAVSLMASLPRPGIHPQLAEAPADLSEVYAYWQSKCQSRSMPSRGDIDPSEIKKYLPGILLVDVVGQRDGERDFVYRLVGTREVQMRGRDPTGRRVAEAFYGLSAESVVAVYDKVCESREPFIQPSYQVTGQQWSPVGTLYLPLSNDGEIVDMILVYSSFKWHLAGWEQSS